MNNFVEKPNLPENDVSLVVVDGRVPSSVVSSIKKLGMEAILTDKCTDLYDAVSYHPDMFMHHLGGNVIIAAPNAPVDTMYQLKSHGFRILYGSKFISRKYPGDTAYNVARIGDYAVCNIKHTDELLLKCLCEMGVTIIDVKQGYSKCSICIVGPGAVISSDHGICRALTDYNFDVLEISSGSIGLEGMNYGFLGGASGFISKNKIAFAGNIMLHPDFQKIRDFLYKNRVDFEILDGNRLVDIGTIIPLKEYK